MDIDPFNEDESEKKYLFSKPTCFIIVGKPGSGKSTLARKLSRVWKCVHVTIPDAIQKAITASTENGLKAQELLVKGDVIPEELSLLILKERLNSPEVQHHGYVLQGFPLLSSTITIKEQLSIIQNLNMPPDYIINLKIPDSDVVSRYVGVKVDPLTYNRYIKTYYENKEKNLVQHKQTPEDDDLMDDEDEREDDGETNISADEEDIIEEIEHEGETQKLFDSLVVRTEDFEASILERINGYNKHLLRKLEDYIGRHDQQKVIELDCNLPIKNVFKNLITLLESTVLTHAVVPLRLQGDEDQEEIPEDTDTEDMLRTLAASKMIAPGFRWRRSKWGRLCPVALSEGQIIQGNPLYSTSFLDKMYFLSSPAAMETFMLNPRQYLLPPQPMPPCKILVLGAPMSGKTTLSAKLADRYDCKVINLDDLMLPKIKEAKEKLMKEQYDKFVANCIFEVKTLKEVVSVHKQAVSGAEEEEGKEEQEERKEEEEEEEEEENEGAGNKEKNHTDVEEDTSVEIGENHPMVQELVANGMKEADMPQYNPLPEDYIECLENKMIEIYKERYKVNSKAASSGGWILDGFPHTKEQLSLMVERNIVPDDVIVFHDDSNTNEQLISRWNLKNRDGDTLTNMSKDDEMKLKIFKDLLIDFDRNWTGMQPTLRNTNNIEPLLLSCQGSIDDAYTRSIKQIESSFRYHGWEYTGMDQDEEEEDQAAAAEEDDDDNDDNDDDPNKKKPFGDCLHFCPVMLNKEHVLWPGSSDIAVKYREKVYFLSTPESKERFLESPEMFLPRDKPLKIPPVRLLLIGPKGSGKTLHGRQLAKKFGIFHISFKDRLQELIIQKTKKKIGPEFEEEEEEMTEDANESKAGENEYNEGENNEEASIEYSEFEENIKNNITENEPLFSETLDAIVVPWWKEEPYRSHGFILEGFPRTPEEASYLVNAGLFPDGTLFLSVDDNEICVRLMPPIFDKWKERRAKKIAEKLKKHNEKLKQREEEKTRRKAAKLLEREERKAEKLVARQAILEEEEEEEEEDGVEEDDDSEGDDEEIDELIEQEMNDEFGEVEEFEDEEETEEDARERIKMEVVEKYEAEMNMLESVQEALEQAMIPRLEVDAARKIHITQYIITKMLKPQVEFRESLLDRCQSISPKLAKKLLISGYKQPSRFGRWCPVKLYDGETFPPFSSKEKPNFPVIYRQHVYFLSTEENKNRFMQKPQTFLKQSSPKPLLPIRMSIIGPPKSGKTTLANRFAQEHGILRLSIGEAMRQVLRSHEKTELVNEMNDHLMKGYSVPDELAVQALQLCLMNPRCLSTGFVLDGYPATCKQMQLLKEYSIIPYKVIDLNVSDRTIMERGGLDRRSSTRTSPRHDSLTILAIRVASYRREVASITGFYSEQYKNLFTVDGEKSKWWVYTTVKEEVQECMSSIQTYIHNAYLGKGNRIKYMCVTPSELKSRLGEYDEYCPVSLANEEELVDCSSNKTHDYVAEFGGKYYKLASESKMLEFLSRPQKYLPPVARYKIPSKENLPKKRSSVHMKKMFPKQMELAGYCPVTYLDGNLRYEALLPGDPDLVVEYKNKCYSFFSEQSQDKFMRFPKKYSSLILPKKLPPKREVINISSLPMLGYLEQTVACSITKALTAVGCLKPKYPYLSAKRSALLYVAYHLKANNPNASEHVRKKYKQQLERFAEECELVSYLSKTMKKKYLEPEDRPIDFDYKLNSFTSLQQIQA